MGVSRVLNGHGAVNASLPFLENHLPLPLVHLQHGDDPPFVAATPLSLTLSRGTGG